jgi:hypothetical protein
LTYAERRLFDLKARAARHHRARVNLAAKEGIIAIDLACKRPREQGDTNFNIVELRSDLQANVTDNLFRVNQDVP